MEGGDNGIDSKTNSMSEIQSFFKGTSVFITGATGFLGHVLLSKLLRSCPDIKQIYVLLREKRGKTAIERFKEMIDDEVFQVIKSECPDILAKVTPIVGDCLKPGLGLNQTDRQLIRNDVDVIFHVAATVRFDAPLRQAVNMNIRSTSDLLDIAADMKKLKAFVHVSTAFSNCVDRKVIEEKLYESPISSENLMLLVDKLSDETLDRITPGLLGTYPNTYVYTKAVAEEVCRTKGVDLPVVIFRPAIVISSAKEPIPGWINNVYGPTGVVAAAAVGLMRSLNTDQNCKANIVPCDYVVNAAIAAAWGVSLKNRNGEIIHTNGNGLKSKPDKSKDIPVYNYSCDLLKKPLSWKEFMHMNEMQEPKMPSSMSVWAYNLTLNKYQFVHQLYCFFLHILPAFFVDNIARLIGKEPKLLDAYQKIHKLSDVLAYFSTREWQMKTDNVMNLWHRLSNKDKEIFGFNLDEIDWMNYFYIHCVGIRKFILKEDPNTIPAAQKRRKRFLMAHYFIITTLACLSFYFSFNVIKRGLMN
uniref:Fatty acyl-CoA reductase n=1 Tax=Phenacoccus solenopsis TaxID=483260 RepID=A0A193CHN6_9HEMI|nr:fatty acyl-CoA reductase I [Phenacoccus solenopsis]